MSTPSLQERSFFGSLFDFGFTTFVTLRFLKVIYAIVMVLIGIGAIGVFVALASEGGGEAVLALIVVPLGALLYLVFARIYFELIALLFRIAESTSNIDRHLTGGGGFGPAGGGYGPPPGSGPGYGGQPPFGSPPPPPPSYGPPASGGSPFSV